MRPPCDSSRGLFTHRQEAGDNLHNEPDHGEYNSLNLEEKRNEQDRHDHDQPRKWEQACVASDHAGYSARCAQCRHHRFGIGKGMGKPSRHAAEQVEGDEP